MGGKSKKITERKIRETVGVLAGVFQELNNSESLLLEIEKASKQLVPRMSHLQELLADLNSIHEKESEKQKAKSRNAAAREARKTRKEKSKAEKAEERRLAREAAKEAKRLERIAEKKAAKLMKLRQEIHDLENGSEPVQQTSRRVGKPMSEETKRRMKVGHARRRAMKNAPETAYCPKCKSSHPMKDVRIDTDINGKWIYKGTCITCNGNVTSLKKIEVPVEPEVAETTQAV